LFAVSATDVAIKRCFAPALCTLAYKNRDASGAACIVRKRTDLAAPAVYSGLTLFQENNMKRSTTLAAALFAGVAVLSGCAITDCP